MGPRELGRQGDRGELAAAERAIDAAACKRTLKRRHARALRSRTALAVAVTAGWLVIAGCGGGNGSASGSGGAAGSGAAGSGGSAGSGGAAGSGAAGSGGSASSGGVAGSGGAASPGGGAGSGGSAGSAGQGAVDPDAPVAALELEARDLTLSVDDAGSTGGDSTVESYSWDFGDGTTASGRTPGLHAYQAAGAYVVTLTVTNSTGKSASTARSVTVSQRHPGDYTPDDATTGVPDILEDRLLLVDLEKAGKSSSNTPTTAEETLFVTRSGSSWVLAQGTSTPVVLPAEHAYVDGDRFVLDRLHVRGYVDVRAPNVTIRRSIIEGVSIPQAPVGEAPGGIDVGRRLLRGNNASTTALHLEDLEVTAPESVRRGAEINAAYHHGIGLEASRLTLLRSEVSGTVDGMQVHQGTGTFTELLVERNYIHDMQFYEVDSERNDGDSSHSDGIQVECSLPAAGTLLGAQILGNVIDVTSDPNVASAIQVTPNTCATSGLLIADNFLDGAVFPINIGTATADSHITWYANGNHFGPNRSTGTKPNKTWLISTTAKVVAAKVNTDGSAAYENFDAAGNQQWVYFSFDPPTSVGGEPPTGEANANVMVDHVRGEQSWGTASRGSAGIGLY